VAQIVDESELYSVDDHRITQRIGPYERKITYIPSTKYIDGASSNVMHTDRVLPLQNFPDRYGAQHRACPRIM